MFQYMVNFGKVFRDTREFLCTPFTGDELGAFLELLQCTKIRNLGNEQLWSQEQDEPVISPRHSEFPARGNQEDEKVRPPQLHLASVWDPHFRYSISVCIIYLKDVPVLSEMKVVGIQVACYLSFQNDDDKTVERLADMGRRLPAYSCKEGGRGGGHVIGAPKSSPVWPAGPSHLCLHGFSQDQ